MSDLVVYDSIRVFVDGKQREPTRSGVDRYRGFYGDVTVNAGSELRIFFGEDELDRSFTYNSCRRVATFQVEWSAIEDAVKASMRAIADGKPVEIASVTLCEDGAIYANVLAERDSELTLFFKDTELKYSVDVIRRIDRDAVVLRTNIFDAMKPQSKIQEPPAMVEDHKLRLVVDGVDVPVYHVVWLPSGEIRLSSHVRSCSDVELFHDGNKLAIPSRSFCGDNLVVCANINHILAEPSPKQDSDQMRIPETCVVGTELIPGAPRSYYECPVEYIGERWLRVGGKLKKAVEYIDRSEISYFDSVEIRPTVTPPLVDDHTPRVSNRLKNIMRKPKTCIAGIVFKPGGKVYHYLCPIQHVGDGYLQVIANGKLETVMAVEYLDHSESDREYYKEAHGVEAPPPFDMGHVPHVSDRLKDRLGWARRLDSKLHDEESAEPAENKKENHNDMDDLVVYRNGVRIDARDTSVSQWIIRTTVNADLDDDLEFWLHDKKMRIHIERKDGDNLRIRANAASHLGEIIDRDIGPPDTCIVAVEFEPGGKVYHYFCPIDLVGARWLTMVRHGQHDVVKAIEYLDLSETDKEYLREVDGVAEVPEYVDLHSPSISDSLAERLRGEGKSEELGTQDETPVKELVLEEQGWSVEKAPREPLTVNAKCTVEHIDTPLQRYAAAGKSSAKCALTGAAAGLALGTIDATTAVALNRYGIAEDHPLVPWVTLAVIFALSTVADAEGAGLIQEVADAALKAQSADMTRALTTDILEPLFQAEAHIAALSASESPQEELPLAARAKLGVT